MRIMKNYTTSEAARSAGVKVSTLRYYEQRGLLAKPPRRGNSWRHDGYRIWSEADIRRVRFIRNAQKLGFSLREIEELIGLLPEQGDERPVVLDRTRRKLAEVRARIRELQKLERSLRELVSTCAGETSADECPIIAALQETS